MRSRPRTTMPPQHVVVNLDPEDRELLFQIVKAEKLSISDCLRRLIRNRARALARKQASSDA